MVDSIDGFLTTLLVCILTVGIIFFLWGVPSALHKIGNALRDIAETLEEKKE